MGHRAVNHRFFRATPQVYAAILSEINAAWGLPRNGQESAFAPVDEAPQRDGLVYLGVQASDCDLQPVATMLPQLLEAGAVEEVSEVEYRQALPTPAVIAP